MIKHRQVQRRGRRSQMTTRYRPGQRGAGPGRGGDGGVRAGQTPGRRSNRGTGLHRAPDRRGRSGLAQSEAGDGLLPAPA